MQIDSFTNHKEGFEALIQVERNVKRKKNRIKNEI